MIQRLFMSQHNQVSPDILACIITYSKYLRKEVMGAHIYVD